MLWQFFFPWRRLTALIRRRPDTQRIHKGSELFPFFKSDSCSLSFTGNSVSSLLLKAASASLSNFLHYPECTGGVLQRTSILLIHTGLYMKPSHTLPTQLVAQAFYFFLAHTEPNLETKSQNNESKSNNLS